MNYQQAMIRAEIMKALAHPLRIMLISALQRGEHCVRDLHPLADIDQSNLSRHLTVLRKAGIVTSRRVGMKVFYRLQTPCILKAFDCAAEVVRDDTRRRVSRTKAL